MSAPFILESVELFRLVPGTEDTVPVPVYAACYWDDGSLVVQVCGAVGHVFADGELLFCPGDLMVITEDDREHLAQIAMKREQERTDELLDARLTFPAFDYDQRRAA